MLLYRRGREKREENQNRENRKMEKKELARRTSVEITFDGVDITKDIQPFLLSMTYTDSEEDESDDLEIQLQDREAIWLKDWLEKAIQASAASKLKISAVITPENWGDASYPLPTGNFELDSVKAGGPPKTITIKGTALPYSAAIRSTKKSRAWESYHLSGIAKEIAKKNGLHCLYEAENDPF